MMELISLGLRVADVYDGLDNEDVIVPAPIDPQWVSCLKPS